MVAVSSKEQICNMSQSHLGNLSTINNIDTPKSGAELTYALWYDVARQNLLKMVIPNFSLARKVIARLDETPPFGYAYVYEYPSDCLKLLGIGNLADKANNYAVEGNRILTDEVYESGMEIRYIKDIKVVTEFSPDFKILLSVYLADMVCLPITQDVTKKKMLEQMLPSYMSALSGVNAQENKPIRISNSRFRAARYTSVANNPAKK